VRSFQAVHAEITAASICSRASRARASLASSVASASWILAAVRPPANRSSGHECHSYRIGAVIGEELVAGAGRLGKGADRGQAFGPCARTPARAMSMPFSA
jgi:hypothetical protein